jgi:hypothetical protein
MTLFDKLCGLKGRRRAIGLGEMKAEVKDGFALIIPASSRL